MMSSDMSTRARSALPTIWEYSGVIQEEALMTRLMASTDRWALFMSILASRSASAKRASLSGSKA